MGLTNKKPIRISGGNNSNRIGPKPILFCLKYLSCIFDEIPAMTFQDIKEKKTFRTDAWTEA